MLQELGTQNVQKKNCKDQKFDFEFTTSLEASSYKRLIVERPAAGSEDGACSICLGAGWSDGRGNERCTDKCEGFPKRQERENSNDM